MEPYSPIWRLHTIGYRNHRRIAVIDGARRLHRRPQHRPRAPRSRRRASSAGATRTSGSTGAATAVLQSVFAIDWRNAAGEDLLGRPLPRPGRRRRGRPAGAGPDHGLGAGLAVGGDPAALLRDDRRRAAHGADPVAVLRARRLDRRGAEGGRPRRRRRPGDDQRARRRPVGALLGRQHLRRRGRRRRRQGPPTTAAATCTPRRSASTARSARSARPTWTSAASRSITS